MASMRTTPATGGSADRSAFTETFTALGIFALLLIPVAILMAVLGASSGLILGYTVVLLIALLGRAAWRTGRAGAQARR